MKLPKALRADMERSLIHAYYSHVCGCDSVTIDPDIFQGAPWVAVAARNDRIWMMDFSSRYEFPPEAKPATVARQMRQRARAAVEHGLSVARFRGESPEAPMPEVVYEIWCFIPPSERLHGALAAARVSGERVVLVSPKELAERVRQTVLASAEQDDENAFVQAATMIRQAFGLQRPEE